MEGPSRARYAAAASPRPLPLPPPRVHIRRVCVCACVCIAAPPQVVWDDGDEYESHEDQLHLLNEDGSVFKPATIVRAARPPARPPACPVSRCVILICLDH